MCPERGTYSQNHPQHAKSAQARLSHYQRQTARRRPKRGQLASNGYKQAKKDAAKTYRKVARQRQDDSRKWAKSVVMNHDQIAMEDFKPKFLAKTTITAAEFLSLELTNPQTSQK